MSVNTIDIDICKGINIKIDRELKIEGCYLNNPNNLTGFATFVIAYELPGYSRTPNCELQKIDSLEIPVIYSAQKNKFPDSRTLFDVSLTGFSYSEALISPNNNACYDINDNEFTALYLVLSKGIYRIFDTIPLKYFVQSGWYERMRFENLVFNCDNSFVEFSPNFQTQNLKMLNFNVEYRL